jgi:hypothetical protein
MHERIRNLKLRTQVENEMKEEQYDFRGNRSVSNFIVAVRQRI